MPRVVIPPIPSTIKIEDLTSKLRAVLRDVETQLQNQPLVSSRQDAKVEQGLKSGDSIIRFVKGVLQMGIFDGKRARFLNAADLQVLQSHSTNFKGRIEGTTAIAVAGTLALFPLQNDWGFYYRTSTSVLYFVFNIDGATLKSVILA